MRQINESEGKEVETHHVCRCGINFLLFADTNQMYKLFVPPLPGHEFNLDAVVVGERIEQDIMRASRNLAYSAIHGTVDGNHSIGCSSK